MTNERRLSDIHMRLGRDYDPPHRDENDTSDPPDMFRQAIEDVRFLMGSLDAAEQHVKILREQVSAHEPTREPSAIQRVCHALTGGCVMITDPERAACTSENCLAMRAAENRGEKP